MPHVVVGATPKGFSGAAQSPPAPIPQHREWGCGGDRTRQAPSCAQDGQGGLQGGREESCRPWGKGVRAPRLLRERSFKKHPFVLEEH